MGMRNSKLTSWKSEKARAGKQLSLTVNSIFWNKKCYRTGCTALRGKKKKKEKEIEREKVLVRNSLRWHIWGFNKWKACFFFFFFFFPDKWIVLIWRIFLFFISCSIESLSWWVLVTCLMQKENTKVSSSCEADIAVLKDEV